jgi:cyclohexanecarboxylate-CoA ligase
MHEKGLSPDARLRVGERARSYRASGRWRGVPLGSTFATIRRVHAGAVALIDGETTLTFARLGAAVDRCVTDLRSLGVDAGDAVAYQLPNWWEAAVTLLASVRLGAHAVPIVPFLRSREVAQILAETRPRVAVVPQVLRGTDYPALFREAAARVSVAEALQLVVARATDPGPALAEGARLADWLAPVETDAGAPEPAATSAPVDAGGLAVVIYTSGSTAAPKGAMHTHETLDAELASLREVHGLGPGDRVLMPSPLTHVSGVIHGILAPALLGTSAVLMDSWDGGRALELVERHGVTYMIGAPTFLQEMLAHPDLDRRDLRSLRLFSCGGASVPPELMRLGRERLPGLVTKRVYGSSEFPTIATTSAEDARTRGLDSEGRALPGVELRVAREDGEPCPPGTDGEIRARGPDCFVGYVDSALDAETFDEDGFLRTGDLGVLDDEGYLTVTGRVKDVIVRKGEKISAREVEDLIALHPAVAEVAVIPLADPNTGERACACIRPASGAAAPTLVQLVSFLRAHDLTSRKLPEALVVRSEFPRAPSGKIHKKRLREEIEQLFAGT